MLHKLISLSPDLQKLSDEGYNIEVCGSHLLVHHIPYLNSKKEVCYGMFVDVLTYATPTLVGRPPDHTIRFQGEPPCDINGNILIAIIANSATERLSQNIIVNHHFSSKPPAGYYANYYEKVRTYAEILSVYAKAIDKSVTARPNKNE